MKYQKTRWSKVYESSEEELVELLDSRAIIYERWQTAEFHDFGDQQFEHDTTFWCADGSIVFIIAGKRVSIQAGDAIRFFPQTRCSAIAGMAGCTIYESLN